MTSLSLNSVVACWHRLLFTYITLLCCLPAPSLAGDLASAQNIDRILVVVNDDIITASELDNQIQLTRTHIAKQKIKAPSEELLRAQVLERAIMDRIQLQLAQRMGITVSDKDIEIAIGNIVKRGNMTEKMFSKRLKKEGTALSDFKDDLRQQLLIQKLIDQQIKRRIAVSDNEVEQFLETRNRLLGGKDAYNISHIMIPIPESTSPEKLIAVKKQAERILAELKKGAGFRETAVAHSRGKEALEGGKLGWRNAGQLPELFVNSLAKMRAGEISDLIRSPNGFHILKLHERRTSKKSKTVTQAHTRHILIRTDDVLPTSDALNKIKELRRRIIGGANFESIAKANSQDPGSTVKGGNLGWVNPGEMVPEFDKAMAKLELNEISEPVRTPFGYHLIQVTERRQKDIGDKLDRADARKQIHARKAEERYQQWVRQLRDEAYIKYLPEPEKDA